MKHKDNVAEAAAATGSASGRHHPAADLQRDGRGRPPRSTAVCQIDYPHELLEIQVLDDSTDETRAIAELAVRRHAAQGFDIKYLHRADRTGYKAGALEAGLEGRARRVHRHLRRRLRAAGRLPAADAAAVRRHRRSAWCRRAGATSTATTRCSRSIQSILLDGHFVLEHGGRNRAGCVLQLQRHRRHLAPRGDHRRGRLAARHAHRRPRPQLSRAAAAAGSSCSCPTSSRPPKCRSR